MYKTANEYYKETFSCKVYKLSLDGGFTCPNRDGTVGVGGCIFCAGDGSGAFAEPSQALAKGRVAHKNKDGKYIAYFQSFTATYAPVERLRKFYMDAITPEEVVGLAIGTRPDCLGEDVLALLREVHAIKPVSVELGLQTMHPASIRYIRRGYENEVYVQAVRKLKEIGIHVVTHIILGLPGENPEMARQTTRFAVAAGTDGVKFHLLHVLQGTDLAVDYAAGKFQCLTMEEYGAWLKGCVDCLPEAVVVHRITGDGAKKDLIAPAWSGDKKRVLNYLNSILKNPG